MDQFVYGITIPTTNTIAYFTEFKSKHYKSFVKTLINNDPYIICEFIDGIIDKLMYRGPSVHTLNVIDKLYILIALRANNVSPTIDFNLQIKDEKKKQIIVTLMLNDMLNVIETFKIKNSFNVTSADTKTVITGTLPKWFYFDNLGSLIASCIDTITFNDKLINLTDFNIRDRISIVDQLPAPVFSEIVNLITEQNEVVSNTPIYTFDAGDVELAGTSEIKISLFDSSCFQLIKMIFGSNLKEFYEIDYHLGKAKVSYQMINDYTPAELSLLFNIISDDAKKQKAEIDKQQEPQGHMVPPKQ